MAATVFHSGPSDEGRHVEESDRLVRATEDHCVFECSGQVFAASLGAVHEVLSGKLATPVPLAPPALVGVVELHGEALPVVQLSALLGIATRPYTPANPIVVLSAHDNKLGVAVDRVQHVRSIDRNSLTSATHAFYRGWCRGVTPAVAVLDAEALVTHALRTVAARLENVLPGATRRAADADGTGSGTC